MRKPLVKRKRVVSRSIFPLRKKADGWWIVVGDFNPDCPEYGPYDDYGEAKDVRDGMIRSRGLERIKQEIERVRSARRANAPL